MKTHLKEQYHGFSMILRGLKKYLDLTESNNNGFDLLTNDKNPEVRMASDGLDEN